MALALAAVFRRHVGNPSAGQGDPAALERRLRELLDACRAAWPGIEVPPEAFVRHLAEHLPVEGDLDACLSRMHGPDLYLACGCAAQDPAALAAFDAGVLAQVVPALGRMRLSDSQIDEVIQVVRAKPLVGDDRERDRRPAIASYAGRGALVGWVRTAARHAALSLRRNMDDRIGRAGEVRALEHLPIPADVELDYLKGRYQAEFKQAIEDALTALDVEQRNVLRLHYMDRLGIDSISALLNIHRATAARRIHAAADAVRAEARRLLHERLNLSARELDSLAGLVQSQLHLSLDRLLGAS